MDSLSAKKNYSSSYYSHYNTNYYNSPESGGHSSKGKN